MRNPLSETVMVKLSEAKWLLPHWLSARAVPACNNKATVANQFNR